ncbi:MULTISPECIES: ABC transporter ATP-binding protein [Variovorax]|jgi:branched-chain amino acid transport system ATP-binding protein|uniref:ABC transporter ATP-binding protein n=1 Tax=Variovorax TaxID=34072 RepID=UPI00086F9CCD|nr:MULTISPECIES: ABC transporter ATP-binding protein [Variovorax]MBN8754565.1 ABC transporter ATP-binding protein [Variovorax sp.]ODU19293.1 MAG: ABC transporter ATP-binding protein [Variovorax sp. SCN 67-85]ODV25196.1 MAG: ABC transporter ATP-binding protein [Variovorax sp. SCN 67-20]OJZ03014.1 MAG: ABC transporter ATP-binding protein [Variovorax sp. 67-131]UKI07518.1 ABC transporter ATP-binding protein [Variovorax paradoxus]
MKNSNSTILEVEDLRAGYGRIEALHGVSIRLDAGELVALVGANGAGKTTLLRTISGLLPSRAGRVRFLGQDISRSSPDIRVRMGLAQVLEGRQVFGPLSVQDNLRLGAFVHREAADERMRRMYDLFPVLKQKKDLPAGTLSGGQQQMLAMARALMSAPKALLLDEPSMGLAPLLVRDIFRVIKELKDAGTPILLVEQNARAALAIADRGYVLETGKMTLEGPAQRLQDDERVRSAYLGL